MNLRGRIKDVNVHNKEAMLLDDSGNRYLLIFNRNHVIPEKDTDFSAQVSVENYEESAYSADSVYTAKVINIF